MQDGFKKRVFTYVNKFLSGGFLIHVMRLGGGGALMISIAGKEQAVKHSSSSSIIY